MNELSTEDAVAENISAGLLAVSKSVNGEKLNTDELKNIQDVVDFLEERNEVLNDKKSSLLEIKEIDLGIILGMQEDLYVLQNAAEPNFEVIDGYQKTLAADQDSLIKTNKLLAAVDEEITLNKDHLELITQGLASVQTFDQGLTAESIPKASKFSGFTQPLNSDKKAKTEAQSKDSKRKSSNEPRMEPSKKRKSPGNKLG